MVSSTHIVLVLAAVAVAAVSALPDGAPLDACVKGNKPNHSKIPAQSADTNPYRIVASTSQYQAGSTITVTISGANLKGFFIQARDVASGGWLGSFKETTGAVNVLPECSAATHADNRDKVSVTLHWTAPRDAAPGQVFFTGSIVKDYATFWADVLAEVAQ
ncbi:putative defense protein 3 [Thrips palmi]|uniref:Defense protein 3 n=1 Tax=Thrips palmi TaxID=161013 RepID=A0A6P8ZS86_THRPL|nr:putative defense protein 3 [Thrips palmi]